MKRLSPRAPVFCTGAVQPNTFDCALTKSMISRWLAPNAATLSARTTAGPLVSVGAVMRDTSPRHARAIQRIEKKGAANVRWGIIGPPQDWDRNDGWDETATFHVARPRRGGHATHHFLTN